MNISEKTVYSCEHCKKRYFSKKWAIRHELICTMNPENFRACLGCLHLESEQVFVEGIEFDVKVLFCPKLGSYVYPPKIELVGKPYKILDENVNQPMPRECGSRKFYENQNEPIIQNTWYF